MLKQVLYYLLLLTTSVRLADMIYLLIKHTTNLPLPVIFVTSLMILYGIVLIVRERMTRIGLKSLLRFYAVQTGMILFNLCYTSFFCPLQISLPESLIVGTFLDVVVNVILIYICLKRVYRFSRSMHGMENTMHV